MFLLMSNIQNQNTKVSEELGFEVRVDAPYDEAIDAVTKALEDEGFVVLTRIDVDHAFRDEIGTHFRPYTILGACNSQLARAALTIAPEIGLMLPCNVTVEADLNGSVIRIANPGILMQTKKLWFDQELRNVATDATTRMMRVAETLRIH
jgi:uncharacterized protein (DUF302 family)